MKKQIAITLEQRLQEQLKQRHENGKLVTYTEALPTQYQVTKIRNACVIDLGSRGPNDLRFVRVGDLLTEAQAQEIARIKTFDVTITA